MLTKLCCQSKLTLSTYIENILSSPTIFIITGIKLLILYLILKGIRDFYFEDFTIPKIINTQYVGSRNKKSHNHLKISKKIILCNIFIQA